MCCEDVTRIEKLQIALCDLAIQNSDLTRRNNSLIEDVSGLGEQSRELFVEARSLDKQNEELREQLRISHNECELNQHSLDFWYQECLKLETKIAQAKDNYQLAVMGCIVEQSPGAIIREFFGLE